MNRTLTFIVLLACGFAARAQTAATSNPGKQPYGTIDQADLEMTACDFEKDASAEILFDTENIFWGYVERHTRIKIFNEGGKKWANVELPYLSGETITNFQAETFNLVNGKIEITKLDKSQLYTQKVDNGYFKQVFAMPDVKAGSVIEYSYTYHTWGIYPKWFYQNLIPERYNELNALKTDISATPQAHTSQPFVKNADVFNIDPQKRRFAQTVMVNVPSLPDEPLMTSYYDNLQSMFYNIDGVMWVHLDLTWPKLVKRLAQNPDFGLQIDRKLLNEDSVTSKAKQIKNQDDRIAYVFNTVRDGMKWNGVDRWYTNDGTYQAWKSKIGNSAEINLVLYRLLKKSGINAWPTLVSTRQHGKVNPAYIDLNQFNRTVICVQQPADTANYYVLDATGKYNAYNQVPVNLLNSIGYRIDVNNYNYELVGLEDEDPVRKVVLIDAQIAPDGKMSGTADISDYNYNRTKTLQLYKTKSEKEYTDILKNNSNGITITGLKLDNMDVDTLPLTQNFSFTANLPGVDEGYIYIAPNIFTSLNNNPFLSEKRTTDIDFGYRDNYSVVCSFKIPDGYKADVLPKSIISVIPDGSIVFKRVIIAQDGVISVRYSIDHKKSLYFKENYADFHEFYKKMYEMLNEQIILKKS